jgi:hypothetical protein
MPAASDFRRLAPSRQSRMSGNTVRHQLPEVLPSVATSSTVELSRPTSHAFLSSLSPTNRECRRWSFYKLKLTNQHRVQPAAVFHLIRRQSRAPPPGPHLRQISGMGTSGWFPGSENSGMATQRDQSNNVPARVNHRRDKTQAYGAPCGEARGIQRQPVWIGQAVDHADGSVRSDVGGINGDGQTRQHELDGRRVGVKRLLVPGV